MNSGPKLAVLGTENFYADLLSQIGGQRVIATSLLNDPNTDPHAFEASPKAAIATPHTAMDKNTAMVDEAIASPKPASR